MKSKIIEARMINGWSLEEAAPRVGYDTKAGLYKLELRSKDHAQLLRIPAITLCKLSQGYGVSIEFLLGLSDDPELTKADIDRQSILRAVSNAVKVGVEQMATQASAAMIEGEAYRAGFEKVVECGSDLISASNRLIELNPDAFEDLRGGATFTRYLGVFNQIVSTAKAKAERDARIAMMKGHPALFVQQTELF